MKQLSCTSDNKLEEKVSILEQIAKIRTRKQQNRESAVGEEEMK